MSTSTPFTIYNASAGSGKTFTLVKEYLKKIFSSSNPGYYRNLLAITFTNKAVAEMKQRIVTTLVAFANDELLPASRVMQEEIISETGLSPTELQQRAKAILKHLLHHYSSFNVETIDRFNHQLIRTFARDLKLSSDFEVTLDTDALLAEAVEKLIGRAGTEKQITQTLLSFALEKTDDDKSWDISNDIATTSKLLTTETDAPHLGTLKQFTLTDFEVFKEKLLRQKHSLITKLTAAAQQAVDLIERNHLTEEDFYKQNLFAYLHKLGEGNYASVGFDKKWQETLEEKPLYPKKTKPPKSTTIDSLAPELIRVYFTTEELIHQVYLLDAILRNLTPLSVIALVQKELDQIKLERNLVPISEFNSLINKEIKNQPAPFIYERLGEKYRHFFVDEHQDTSLLQWENLIPLIENALVQAQLEQGSLLLVGDAKQSIYRWRGGLPEQFMGLYENNNPFPVQKRVENLGVNFRSKREIIDFNNQFFQHISNFFGDNTHENLYKIGNRQESQSSEGGFVHLEFLDRENTTAKEDAYAERVLQTIAELKSDGYREADICILTRKREDGVKLSEALLAEGISVVSTETLLLENSPKVQFLISLLTLTAYPDRDEAKIKVLDFIHDQGAISMEKHSFFESALRDSTQTLSELFAAHELEFSIEKANSLPLYQAFEYAIETFQLYEAPNAFLFGFMDLVFDYTQQRHASTVGFFEFWETKREKAALSVGESADAVQLMTIHKAKGLEFPVVLYPYANSKIYGDLNPKTWYELEAGPDTISPVWLNLNQQLSTLSEQGLELYNESQNTQELDAINVLYVTLTRAVERLYIFTEKPASKKTADFKQYGELFQNFLEHRNEWSDARLEYSFGTKQAPAAQKTHSAMATKAPTYWVSRPESHTLTLVTKDALLWGKYAQEAIDTGTLLHDTMARIKTQADIEPTISSLRKWALYAPEVVRLLHTSVEIIVAHPHLKELFSAKDKVMNERDIVTNSGTILRPDRINIHESGDVTIVDYKTGGANSHHTEQVHSYAQSLADMGYKIRQRLLVYINEEGIVVNKV
ncbi:MAG: DNA helicase UvrD [Flavobacteriaceae bacterium]|nr:DNA helicase UvrD [Flavobacteriaceae bacterium]